MTSCFKRGSCTPPSLPRPLVNMVERLSEEGGADYDNDQPPPAYRLPED